MPDETEFSDEEWERIRSIVKPLRFQSEGYAELYEKINDHVNQL